MITLQRNKNMKKMLLLIGTICLIGLFGSGCTSIFTPENIGYIAGKSLAITYLQVSDNMNAEFNKKVNFLWTQIDQIETTDDLVALYKNLQLSFDDILADKNLTVKDRELLYSMAKDILDKVSAVINNDFTQTDGLDFLIGVREGVRSIVNK